ncbi:hypothetical protein FRB90_006563 [Tulasnella sp. 427]|nr:hypothetical protein FRB90_006563 [Tulasnella sp. 427]
MRFFTSASAVALFATAAYGAVIPRADNATSTSTACYSVHTGYLTVFPGTQPSKHVPVGLNTQNQVTYGVDSDQKFLVEFQTCPSLPGQAPNLDMYNGRIVKSGTTNCVTVSNPTAPDNGPFFLEVAACQSDTQPPASQQWEYGNDFGAVVFWKGANENGEIGWMDDGQSNPTVEQGTNRIELGCATSCSSFNITPEDQL